MTQATLTQANSTVEQFFELKEAFETETSLTGKETLVKEMLELDLDSKTDRARHSLTQRFFSEVKATREMLADSTIVAGLQDSHLNSVREEADAVTFEGLGKGLSGVIASEGPASSAVVYADSAVNKPQGRQ